MATKLDDNLPEDIDGKLTPEQLLALADEMPEQRKKNQLAEYEDVLVKLKYEKFMSNPQIALYMTRAGVPCKGSTVMNFFRSRDKRLAGESDE